MEPSDKTSAEETFRSAFGAEARQRTYTGIQAATLVVFALTVLVPVFWYTSTKFHGLFSHPALVLVGICSLGGAVCTLLCAEQKRFSSSLAGAFMGAGSALMVVLLRTKFIGLLQIAGVSKLSLLLAMFLGALPGLLWWAALRAKRS